MCGAVMIRHFSLGLFAIALVTIAAIPNGSVAQGASLKDQLVGTWIYVSSTVRRDDGSNVPIPSTQGAVTYTADGRFHFIRTRTDAPKYASGDLARPSPDEAMAIASGSLAYTGTYTVDEGTKTIHVNIETSTFPNLVGAPNQRRIVTSITAGNEVHESPHTRRPNVGDRVEAGEVTFRPAFSISNFRDRPARPARRPLVRIIFCYWYLDPARKQAGRQRIGWSFPTRHLRGSFFLG